MEQGYEEIAVAQGSAKQLIEMGLRVNDRFVDGVALSIFQKYGLAEVLKKEEKPEGSRGRPGSIYKLQSTEGFQLSITE